MGITYAIGTVYNGRDVSWSDYLKHFRSGLYPSASRTHILCKFHI